MNDDARLALADEAKAILAVNYPTDMNLVRAWNFINKIETVLRASQPGTVSRETVARKWLQTVWTNEYADVFERTNHMEWKLALVGADAILSLSIPANGRKALEEIAAFNITPDTGYSVAQAMRRTAEAALFALPVKED